MNTCSTFSARNNSHASLHMLDSAALLKESAENEMDHASLLLTEALNAAHNAPDIRRARVEAIRAQIESGEYEIDSRKLAESLIRENPDLFEEWS